MTNTLLASHFINVFLLHRNTRLQLHNELQHSKDSSLPAYCFIFFFNYWKLSYKKSLHIKEIYSNLVLRYDGISLLQVFLFLVVALGMATGRILSLRRTFPGQRIRGATNYGTHAFGANGFVSRPLSSKQPSIDVWLTTHVSLNSDDAWWLINIRKRKRMSELRLLGSFLQSVLSLSSRADQQRQEQLKSHNDVPARCSFFHFFIILDF